MPDPSAAAPWTVTLAWTPDQNFGAVSALNGRVALHAIFGLLHSGEAHETVAAEFGLSGEEVAVLDRLRQEMAPEPIADLIERSSLGTPEAKAARESVSDERAAEVVAQANRLHAAADVAATAMDEAIGEFVTARVDGEFDADPREAARLAVEALFLAGMLAPGADEDEPQGPVLRIPADEIDDGFTGDQPSGPAPGEPASLEMLTWRVANALDGACIRVLLFDETHYGEWVRYDPDPDDDRLLSPLARITRCLRSAGLLDEGTTAAAREIHAVPSDDDLTELLDRYVPPATIAEVRGIIRRLLASPRVAEAE